MDKEQFMNNISSDILQQNHYLKGELIRTRKHLKQYEEKIRQQLENASKTINFQTQFLNYESGQQLLAEFIRLVHASLHYASECQLKYRKKGQQASAIDQKIAIKQQQLSLQAQQINQLHTLLANQQKETKTSKKQLIKLNEKYESLMKNSALEIGRLKLEIQKLQRDLTLKFKIQKRQAIDKVSRQLIEYRHNIQKQFTKNQKQLRIEIEKKDRDLKSLLATIHTLVESAKTNKPEANPTKKTSNTGYEEQINMLQSVLQPFKDHNALNSKIGELRKQQAKIQQENRNSSTYIVELEVKNADINTQLGILSSQLEIEKYKYEDLYKQFQILGDQNEKYKADMEALENYYDNKWGDQFQSMRVNLQKKYHNKQEQLENQYQSKFEKFQLETRLKQQQIDQIKQIKSQVQNRENNLKEKLLVMSQKLDDVETNYSNSLRIQRQRQSMLVEELSSVKYQYEIERSSYLKTIEKYRQQQQSLKEQLQGIKIECLTIMKKMEQEHKESIQAIMDIHNRKQAMLMNENKEIAKKMAVGMAAKSQQIKMIHQSTQYKQKQLTTKLSKQKQEAIAQLKVQFHEQLSKKLTVIQNRDQELASLQQQMTKNKKKYFSQRQKCQQILQDKSTKIRQLELKISLFDQEKAQLLELVEARQKEKKEVLHQKQSIEVLFNSRQMEIYNFSEQILQYERQKSKWRADLDELRIDYQRAFKQLKEHCEKMVGKSNERIKQLQKIQSWGLMSENKVKEIEELTNKNHHLEQQIKMKNIEILQLTQDKKHFELRSQQSESKIALNYQLRWIRDSKQSVFIKKHHHPNLQSIARNLKTERGYYQRQSKEEQCKDKQVEKGTSNDKLKDRQYSSDSKKDNYQNILNFLKNSKSREASMSKLAQTSKKTVKPQSRHSLEKPSQRFRLSSSIV